MVTRCESLEIEIAPVPPLYRDENHLARAAMAYTFGERSRSLPVTYLPLPNGIFFRIMCSPTDQRTAA